MTERMIEMTDAYAEFMTNAQSAIQGRITLPKWLCDYFGLGPGAQVRLEVEGRNHSHSGPVALTSGTEIVAGKNTGLYRVLRPGARVKVRLYRPRPARAALSSAAA